MPVPKIKGGRIDACNEKSNAAIPIGHCKSYEQNKHLHESNYRDIKPAVVPIYVVVNSAR